MLKVEKGSAELCIDKPLTAVKLIILLECNMTNRDGNQIILSQELLSILLLNPVCLTDQIGR